MKHDKRGRCNPLFLLVNLEKSRLEVSRPHHLSFNNWYFFLGHEPCLCFSQSPSKLRFTEQQWAREKEKHRQEMWR